MKLNKTFFLTALLLSVIHAIAQTPSYTADEKVVSFAAPFGYGVNPGYYDGFDREGVSNDVALAELARKIGLNTWRPTLPAYFFLQYGNTQDLSTNNYNLRIAEFNEYKKMGIVNNVVFIGEATDHHSDSKVPGLIGANYRNVIKHSGCDRYSYEFKNMYEPIWDGGTNGTPVNENNYYALYVYKIASKYKDFIKVYEVVNEIDYPGLPTVEPDTWLGRNPTPCELLNWNAPIFSYVRMLRITYEVVKSINPNAFVAIGGIGYNSFLDVVLRNSDNPADGSVQGTDYPKKGGAYFDVVSYHLYPHYDLKKRNALGQNIFPFVYQRHSDEASERVMEKRDKLQEVCAKYKYDDTTYPMKHFIITETNIPRRTYDGEDWIGSDDAQKNFITKVMIKAQKKNIKQVHVFALGESADLSDVTNKEGHEGLYTNLKKAKRTDATRTPAGVSLQTTTSILDSLTYDDAKTTQLALPATVDGAAFKNASGKYVYILWAKTTTDMSETAAADYTFPSSFGITGLIKAEWNFVVTGTKTTIASNKVSLTGYPSYVTSSTDPVDFSKSAGLSGVVTGVEQESKQPFSFTSYPNPANRDINFSFFLKKSETLDLDILSIRGETALTIVKQKHFPAGKHTLNFKNSLAPGIYMGRLTSKSGYKSVVKLVIE